MYYWIFLAEKEDFDGKNYHVVSQYKDRHWYQNKHYCEDSQKYIYPYDDRGGPPAYQDFFKSYQRFPTHNLRFHHRGGFYPRRRGFYIPRWQKYSRGRHGLYQNFQKQGFASDPSCYYDNMTNDYYRYFQKLAKGDKGEESSDTQSQDSQSINQSHSSKHSRLSRSKSRSLSRTRSHSKSRSQSRSSSRTLPSKRFRSHSRSWSQRKSRSRTRSYSRTHSKTWTRSPSQSVTHSKWNDGVEEKSAMVESVTQSKDERTLRRSHSKKKRHKRDDACSDSDKVRVKHKR